MLFRSKIRDMEAAGVLTSPQVKKLLFVPPESRLVHAGPLEICPWEEGKPWSMSDWALAQNGWSEQPVTR